MKIDTTMAGKDGGGSTDVQPTLNHSATSPNLQSLAINTPEFPQATGWKGLLSRRGSNVEFLSKTAVEIPKPPTERKTSLTPEMDKIPADFLSKYSSNDISDLPSPGVSPRRGSLFQGFVDLGGGARRGSLLEADETDFKPPENLGRRPSMTDAFQWLFKPMNTQPTVGSRDINVISPTST